MSGAADLRSPSPPSEPTPAAIDPLDQTLAELRLVTAARAKKLAALGIHTLFDLLDYFPRDYRHESAEVSIGELQGDRYQLTRGEVCAADLVPVRPKPRFNVTLAQGPYRLHITFFNGGYLRGKIVPGSILRVRGSVRVFRNKFTMANPKWELIEPDAPPVDHAILRPIYPATADLTSDRIAESVARHLPAAMPAIREWFHPAHVQSRGLIPRPVAFHDIHQPADQTRAFLARRRLMYDELMLMQLGLAISRRRRDADAASHAAVLRIDKNLDQRIRKLFAFEFTPGQLAAAWRIAGDMKGTRPMLRLLQGDVGSGKTAVAVYAMLIAVANGYQAALLAPTQVLAEQHYLTLRNLLVDSKVGIELLTGRTRSKGPNRAARSIESGIAVGTQALLEHDVRFSNLALVVVDEQHRLGVRQRQILSQKGNTPHYLIMTATPIPRTLALSRLADLDVTVIDELPPGRQPITTTWLTMSQESVALETIRREVAAGRQAYIVLPSIDPMDESRGVVDECKRLQSGPLKNLRLATLHGKMKPLDKQGIMLDFRAGRIDVLVATTVIEVGIDVPNATVIVIEFADRLGLSQLHQLRGRVGRGTVPSSCLLLADPATPAAESRLRAVTQTSDGFEIAQLDLSLRGPGEFFGTRQHGLPEFKLADLSSESDLFELARQDSQSLLAADPNLMSPVHAPLRAALRNQFGSSIDLPQIA
jgi:ATP-dependent DNA helicase RecG